MIRFYLLPIEVNGNARGPRYFAWRHDPDPPALIQDVTASFVDYGMEPVFLCGADVTDAQHTLLAAQIDVTAIPANLDQQIGAARATVEAKLESYGIPGNWVVSGATYRQLQRAVLAIFKVAQRFAGLGYGRLTPPGVTLATPYSAMPVVYRDHLVQAIDALGYDRSTMTASSTLRDLLTSIADQGVPEELLGVAI